MLLIELLADIQRKKEEGDSQAKRSRLSYLSATDVMGGHGESRQEKVL